MHYRNGREAKNGDKVVVINKYGLSAFGILYDAMSGNDTCNGRIALVTTADICPDLRNVLHIEDAIILLDEKFPETNK